MVAWVVSVFFLVLEVSWVSLAWLCKSGHIIDGNLALVLMRYNTCI